MEETDLANYKVSINREGCIGDAICTALSKNWFMDRDGKASFHSETIEDHEYGSNHEAEISCPVAVISVRKIS